MTYLRPDSKAQVTIVYDDDNTPIKIKDIVVSTQHDEFDSDDERMLNKIKSDVKGILMPRVISQLPSSIQALFTNEINYHINPTGKFVIGGPHGDTGLTGRKIIVDTYGGKGAHGGGAFSGKDPSKVDRSAAYAMRHIAKNMVAAGVADQILVQVSYAIGVAAPMGVFVDTSGSSKVNMSDGEIAEKISELFDLRPAAIIKRLNLLSPIYSDTAAYGHMGRVPEKKKVQFMDGNSVIFEKEVETFTWEKLDHVDEIKSAFGL
jgi:S-adenosylmethionine synthetase